MKSGHLVVLEVISGAHITFNEITLFIFGITDSRHFGIFSRFVNRFVANSWSRDGHPDLENFSALDRTVNEIGNWNEGTVLVMNFAVVMAY